MDSQTLEGLTVFAAWGGPLLGQSEWIRWVFRPEIVIFMIPIVAIVIGGVISMLKMWIKHRERMGLIEHGIHPDYPPEETPHGGAPGA